MVLISVTHESDWDRVREMCREVATLMFEYETVKGDRE